MTGADHETPSPAYVLRLTLGNYDLLLSALEDAYYYRIGEAEDRDDPSIEPSDWDRAQDYAALEATLKAPTADDLASVVTAYQQAAYAHGASLHTLTELCERAEEDSDRQADADDHRHYAHADHTEHLAAIATELLTLLGFPVTLPDFAALAREGDTVRTEQHAGLWKVAGRFSDGTASIAPVDREARANLDMGKPCEIVPLTDLTVVSPQPTAAPSDEPFGWNDPAVREAVRQTINERDQ
jgi:hypothetical protein